MQEKGVELNNQPNSEIRPKYPLKYFLVNSHLMPGKSFAYYHAMQINMQKSIKKFRALHCNPVIYFDNSSCFNYSL